MWLPEVDTPGPFVLRTYSADSASWRSLCDAIESEFDEEVHFITDSKLEGQSLGDLLEQLPVRSCHSSVFIADERAFKGSESTLLVVDLWEEPGRSFRVVLSQMLSVHANLWLANMDFVDYADSVDSHGVFRGFSE
jgi:hypothetical protein